MSRVTEHAKKHGFNYGKLVAGIAALTTAVNGYLDLAKQNELMLQALGSKLNSLSVKVAYIEGRMDIVPTPTAMPSPRMDRAPASVEPAGGGAAESSVNYVAEARVHLEETGEYEEGGPPLHSEGEEVVYVAEAGPETDQVQIQLDAYDDVPLSMNALREQAQEQVQEEQ